MRLPLLALFFFFADGGPRVAFGSEEESTGTPETESPGTLVPAPTPHALILEPKFMGSKQFVLLPQSKETGFVPARWDGERLEPYSREEFRALELPWKRFFEHAVEAMELFIASLEAKYYRDANEVITHGVVESEVPFLASVIASPAFRDRFSSTLGTEFFVVAPNRSTLILLPKSANNLAEIQEVASHTFEISTYPVSLELIEIKKDGIRVIGKFDRN
ncbi:MAG: hypothetical protein AAGJ79_01090 [Verrucomicrobiota bacterium]